MKSILTNNKQLFLGKTMNTKLEEIENWTVSKIDTDRDNKNIVVVTLGNGDNFDIEITDVSDILSGVSAVIEDGVSGLDYDESTAGELAEAAINSSLNLIHGYIAARNF